MRCFEHTQNGEYHIWFYNPKDMQDWIAKESKPHPNNERNRTATRNGYHSDSDWYGFDMTRASQFQSKLEEGWPRFMDAVSSAASQLQARFDSDVAVPVPTMLRRRKRTRGAHGDEITMTRVWNGQLDTAWTRPVKKPRHGHGQRYITIMIDVVANGRVPAGNSVWQGACAMLLHDMLVRMGYATEVWVGSSAYNQYRGDRNRKQSWTAVRVKQCDQTMTPDTVAIMSSLAMLRSKLFEIYESSDVELAWGYGSASSNGLVKPLRDRAAQGERVIRMGNIFSYSAALEFIQSNMEELRKASSEEAA